MKITTFYKKPSHVLTVMRYFRIFRGNTIDHYFTYCDNKYHKNYIDIMEILSPVAIEL